MHRPLRVRDVNVEQHAQDAPAQRKTPTSKLNKNLFEQQLTEQQKAAWLERRRQQTHEMLLAHLEDFKLAHPDVLQRKQLHELWERQWQGLQGGSMELLEAVNARIVLQGAWRGSVCMLSTSD